MRSGPAVSSWGGNRLDVFALGMDNALWHKWFTGSWSDWESLGGQLTSGPAGSRIDVFARGAGHERNKLFATKC